MVFSSMSFMAFFLPVAMLLYFVWKDPRWRNGVLIVFSLLFYAWGEPQRILIMLASILVNYLMALVIDRAESKPAKRLALALCMALTLGVLVYFKYFAFFVNSVGELLGLGQLAEPRSLPIGISFYTFQIVTYTVDVYLGKTPVQRSLPRLMMYISFFPQLIAGPIVNYTYIAPQLAERKTSLPEVYAGLQRFIIGLAKKILLANVCGEIIAEMGMGGGSILAAWLGAIAYTFQIYFDFSGYSDMAIGMGRIFGFKFHENFNYPYISTSVTEFWRRWHISLGSFFREYVYIPLGGNRCGRGRQIFNLAVVWALTGLWHGASGNFIAWGVYYGVLLILEKQFFLKFAKSIPGIIRWAVTMLIVIFGWVLFYHESLADGFVQMGAMLGIGAEGGSDPAAVYYLKQYLGVLIISALACLPWKAVVARLGSGGAHSSGNPFAGTLGRAEWLKSAAVSLLLILCLAFMVSGSYNPFLYFRF